MACVSIINLANRAANRIGDKRYETAIELLGTALLNAHKLPLLHGVPEINSDSEILRIADPRKTNNHSFYADGGYDEGMSAYCQPFHVHTITRDRSLIEAALYFNLGIAHTRIADDKKALLLFEKSNDILTSTFINDLPVFMIAINFGHIHWRAERYSLALHHYTQALQSLGGSDTVKRPICVSAILNCIAVTKFHMRQDATLEITIALSLSVQLPDLTISCRQTATIINNDGRIKLQSQEYPEALNALLEALKRRRYILGDMHLDVAATLFDVAQTYQHMGNISEAISYYKRFLLIGKEALGNEHQDVRQTLLTIGKLCRDINDLGTAHDALTEALKSTRAVWNQSEDGKPGSMSTHCDELACILSNLASVIELQGNYAESISVYKELVFVYKYALGSQHFHVSSALNDLGLVQFKSGEPNAAIVSFLEAIEIRQALSNSTPRDIATLHHNAAATYKTIGDPMTALNHYKEALRLDRSCDDYVNHKIVLIILSQMAVLFQELGQLDEALESLQDATRTCAKHPEEVGRANASQILRALGNLYHKIGDVEKAKSYHVDYFLMFFLPPVAAAAA